MTSTRKYPLPSARVLALLLSGIGLLLIAVASLFLLHRQPSSRPTSDNLADYPSVVPVKVNFAAPRLNLNDLNGKPVSLEDYRGKVVLINNWAFWCPPCRAELPTLETYYQDHQQDNFVIIGIDSGDEFADVDYHVKKYSLTYPIWLDPQTKAADAFNTDSLPTSFVVNPQGQVVLAWAGSISREMLDQYLTPILEK
jgi:peroxiredoxin